MALTSDYRAIEGYDSLTDDETVTRDCLVWASMATGMNTITVENAREFYARASFWEKVNGAYRHKDGEALYFTPEDVLRFVGMRTNASAKTKTQFYKSVWECHERWNVPSSI